MNRNRKHNLGFSLLLIVLVLLMGPALAQAPYGEAPSLTHLVEAGQLPPVEERLPENPMVVPVVERIGDYGGTWRMALLGGGDTAMFVKTISYEHLMRWHPDWTEVIPNIAESVEVNEEATEFTFHLRRGIRWSDGEPFTSADIMFWYEDVLLNEEITPVVTGWMQSGGEPGVVKVNDDYTVTFSFAAPHGLFLQRLATPSGADVTRYPRHYAEQFHISHNPEGIDALVQEAGVDDWASLFTQRADRFRNPELPTLNGWVLLNGYGEGTQVVAERNPYYWKVDPEGNQLPYIDRVTYDVIADVEVMVLRGLAGELDMQSRHIGTQLANRAIFFDYLERGDYRFFDTVPARMNTTIIAFNLAHQDPVKREIFQNKDFRIGLSHAINRQEIIDLVFIAQGEPWQAAPRPESPFYNERLAKQYTEYDVELANGYLDSAGYAERDHDSFRLGPDGNRISFVVEVVGDRANLLDPLEVIQGYWREVGIDMQIRTMDTTLFYTRTAAGEHDAAVWQGDGGLDVVLEPRWYFPYNAESHFGNLWARWFNNQAGAEEPPAAAQRQMELYRELLATGDPERQDELMREILDIAADEFYALGINLEPTTFGIARNHFRNVPESMPFAWLYPNPSPTNPEQYFIEAGN